MTERQHHEISVTARDAQGREHTEHLELSSTYASTPQKAAEVAAQLLAGNQNGGMGTFKRMEADR